MPNINLIVIDGRDDGVELMTIAPMYFIDA